MNEEIQQRIENYKKYECDMYFLEDLERVLQEKDEKEILERFYTTLEFGTGGIRGVVGAGTNRLNSLMVRTVATGWAQYLQACYGDASIVVVIAYDSRNFSDVFSHLVSETLANLGVRVYAFDNPRPTPQLSLCIREIGAQSGMVITASHNPPQYNGLKIYGEDGAQLVSPHDAQVMEYIAKAIPKVPSMNLEEAGRKGLYTPMDASYDAKFQDYIERVLTRVRCNETSVSSEPYLVVYTPLHGTGAFHVEAATRRFGINCFTEPSQCDADGHFPTVEYPNPEDPKALSRAIETAKKQGASLVLANDPDADRVGLAECQDDGNFLCITGNQIGALLLHFVLSHDEANVSEATPVVINTIVTTSLQEKIAKDKGAEVLACYTGFKNVAMLMREVDNNMGQRFLFACEESYGYLASEEVRDKDGVSTAILCMHMAKTYYEQGLKLIDVLENLYLKYGYHEERAVSRTFLGREGKEKIHDIMRMLREKTPRHIGSERVTHMHDYHVSRVYSVVELGLEVESDISLPPSDVLMFVTEGGNKICVRPSGTEPKIKFYLLYSAKPDAEDKYEAHKCALKTKLDIAEKEVKSWLGI